MQFFTFRLIFFLYFKKNFFKKLEFLGYNKIITFNEDQFVLCNCTSFFFFLKNWVLDVWLRVELSLSAEGVQIWRSWENNNKSKQYRPIRTTTPYERPIKMELGYNIISWQRELISRGRLRRLRPLTKNKIFLKLLRFLFKFWTFGIRMNNQRDWLNENSL